jgi:hypothetical protein
MTVQHWGLARRELLRRLGVGAACLPLLSAGRARAAAPRRTLVVVVQSLGYRMSSWLPPLGPLTGSLPSSTAPLEPHKEDLIFLPDLTDQSLPAGTSGLLGYGTILYGLPDVVGTSYREPNGPTVDQVVGRSTGGSRRSIVLGVQIDRPPRASDAPGARRCSWAGPGQPINPEQDPFRSYDALFGGRVPDDTETRRLLLERRSILDYVGGSLDQFGKRLGSDDRAAIQGHQQAIRDLENELQSGGGAGDGCGAPGSATPVDLEAPENFPVILKIQMDLLVAALRCGLTQVVVLQLCDAAAKNVALSFVPGVPPPYVSPLAGSWYELGHNPVIGGVDRKRLIDQWLMQRFSELLDRMKAVTTPDGTLLDGGVVLWANTMQDGANRDAQHIPWVLAGRCGGYFKTGQVAASAGKPTSSVLAELCRALGVAGEPFGKGLEILRAP